MQSVGAAIHKTALGYQQRQVFERLDATDYSGERRPDGGLVQCRHARLRELTSGIELGLESTVLP